MAVISQFADFCRYNAEAPALFACPGCLNRSIKPQHMGLICYPFDGGQNFKAALNITHHHSGMADQLVQTLRNAMR
ncbi:hypothetical protein D3C85_1426090 [compost metagenome]